MLVEIHFKENEQPVTFVEASLIRFNTTLHKGKLTLYVYSAENDKIELTGIPSIINHSWGTYIELITDNTTLLIRIYR